MPVRKNKSSITFAKRVVKSDTQVVIQHTLDLEDEFNSIYEVSKSNAALQPPFNPLVLKRLCTRNNILMQCVHAMETNIDGTGHEIADEDQDKDDERKPQPAPALENSPVDFNAIPNPVVRGAAAAALVTADRGGQDTVQKEAGPAVVAAASAATAIQTRKVTQGIDPPSQFPLQPEAPLPVDPLTGMVDPNAETPQDLAEKAMLKAFFKEPFPNESMVSIRRKLRVDLESTGNAYLEIIRNLANEIVFVRHLDSSTMRLVKLDNPVAIDKVIERDGKQFTATVWERQRRFVQRVGTNYIYYKEFGSTRKLSREDGGWLDEPGQTGFPQVNPGAPHGAAKNSTALLTLKGDLAQQRMMDNGVAPGPAAARPANLTNADGSQKVNMASEVLHFIVDKDATTPYGIPRWINNLPAVLGSRKAEEFNLDFFDAGGLPPAIIFIQGGALAASVKDQLLAYLSGTLQDKQRAAVVEAQSSSGSLDSAGQVKVTVERFGDNRQNGTDSMFQIYDEKCENHVRGAFRMPSIFLGKANDYNFATALTAVMVTEAQVFSPERKEFDEKINHTIVRALGAKRYKFKSLPITLKNVDIQLKALAVVMDKVSGPDLIDTINQITGLSLVYDETTAQQAELQKTMEAQAKGAVANGGDPFNSMQPQGKKKNPFAAGLGASSGSDGAGSIGSMSLTKSDLTSNDIVMLAAEWANAVGLTEGPHLEREVRRAIVQKVEGLPAEQRKLFNAVLATSTFARSSFDAEGLAELAGSCVGLMDHTH